MKYFNTLTIAASDSSGGAGIQADLKTFSALSCNGMSVITAITAQNTFEIKEIFKVPVKIVESQIDAVMEDILVDAVKIGMLYDKEIILSVVDRLKYFKAKNIVLDTVMVSTCGDNLLKNDSIDTLKKSLFPIVDIITPNLPEAATLLGYSTKDIVKSSVSDMKNICKELSKFGTKAVLLKGGHLCNDQAVDILYEGIDDKFSIFRQKKIITKNSHGTGCTLSSALASYLAMGKTTSQSVELAKKYLTQAINFGKDYKTGRGSGPVMHFFGNNYGGQQKLKSEH